MHKRFLSSLFVASLSTALAAPALTPKDVPTLGAVDVQELSVNHLTSFVAMFEQARTALTGTQGDPLDTFPCQDGTLFVAEGGRGSNFQTAVDDLKRQGWRVEQEQPITDGRFTFSEFRALSLTKEGVTVLATWIRSADSETSLLSACTQRPQARREPVAQPLAVAPSLPAKFSVNNA